MALCAVETAPLAHAVPLSSAEQAWIALHPVITVALDADNAPLNFRQADGSYAGLSVDYLHLLAERLGLRLDLRGSTWDVALSKAMAHEVDALLSASDKEERRTALDFTAPYCGMPLAMVTRDDQPPVVEMADFAKQRIAVVRGSVRVALLKEQVPTSTLTEVDSARAGLRALAEGRVDGFFDDLPVIQGQVAALMLSHVRVALLYFQPEAGAQRIAVRNDAPLLHAMLERAIAQVTPEEHRTIRERWLKLAHDAPVQRELDYSLVWKIGVPAALLLAAFLSWNRRLRGEINRRTIAEGELIAYRDRLEHLVRERTADLEFALGRLRRLGAAIDQTTEAVVLAAPDGQIEFVNPAFAQMTGITADAASALDLAAIGLPWSDPALRRGDWHGRVRARRADGVEYEFEAVVSAVADSNGVLIDLLAVLRDITAAKRIEERLAQSQKLEAVGTLAGGIAHDFNNILAAILGSAELAERPGVTAERRSAYLARIITASDRARQLVQQILAFSRGNQGARRPLELAPVIIEALELLRASLPTTIQFERRLVADAVVLGDATRIHQLVMNLGTNAGLAMPDGGVLRVELEVIELDPVNATQLGMAAGPTVRMTVSDTGVGMTRAVMSRIFEPFFTTRAQGQGTGLGLAVVHGLIRDLHGAINVTSELGQGTTFTIYLPRCLADSEPVTSTALPAVTGNGERILFVDDEPALRHNAADMLNALGYRVMVAANGPEALALLRQDPGEFDLLITDATMPYMTGIDLIVAARELAPQLRMILCSGQSDPGSGSRPAEVAFLAKPITSRDLVSAIRKSLKTVGV